MTRESGVIHTIHTPYNGNEFSPYNKEIRETRDTDRSTL